jgi:pseudouridine-5'-phosphate glycosidase
LRLDTPDEIAAMLRTKWTLGLEGSVLVANPVPQDQEVPSEIMEVFIQRALKAAKQQNIRGKKLTPFLLKYIADHTQGESLEANIALIRHNAKLGAEIAKAFVQKPFHG